MSLLSWNCRGIGNPETVQVLVDLVHKRKPVLIFLMETLSNSDSMLSIKQRLGWHGCFTVDPVGRGGGLALLWKEEITVTVTSSSLNHIDTEIQLEGSDAKWRFTGFYGISDRTRRVESWNLLTNLATRSNLPWLLMGDFNDLLHHHEKRGRHPHPEWLLRGFRHAVDSAGLRGLFFEGHQFTWEKGRGTENWVEEKLDRILANDSWFEKFDMARAISEDVPSSDHLPLIATLIPTARGNRVRRFRFENVWIKESRCRELLSLIWENSRGEEIPLRLNKCSHAI
ncbi:PREDICTED: uncharacterized protein LOC109186215 [Ipomoea nil]|uniref:uncharacterized protein LOC109186215 n=1 Tax=Ipomoea nil TaxID=35883 RepID=UPI000901BD24|nr:PREDICTED: uncharacterized protein LOC109186215 [Ipomoea nil]